MMNRIIRLLILLLLSDGVYAAGLMPVPVLNNVQIRAGVRLAQSLYNYAYTVTNPSGNTGNIWHIRIDILNTNPSGQSFPTTGLTIPIGGQRYSFEAELGERFILGARPEKFVPFGQNVPSGWHGGLDLDAFATFNSSGETVEIKPGTSLAGFELLSPGVPTIRETQIEPWWVFVVENHDAVSIQEREEAGKIERDIVFKTVTLGPSGVVLGSFAHWNQLRDDLAKAIQLGWITDSFLAVNLTNQLASARQALDAHDRFTTKGRLRTLLDTINQSTPPQRTSEGFGLISLNVQSLIDNTADNPIEPKVSLSPKSAVLSIGSRHTLVLSVIDLANGNRPLSGVPVRFAAVSGPHVGNLGSGQTDVQGRATISYIGKRIGADRVIASAFGGEISFDDTGIVLWEGGPDLVVPLFIPPILKTAGGRTIKIDDNTENIGSVAAGASVTRYFISSNPIVDTKIAQVIGERSVPPLQAGESSRSTGLSFSLPNGLFPGMYFLAACADGNNVIVELDKTNNCSFNKVQGRQSVVLPMECNRAASKDTDAKKPRKAKRTDDDAEEEECEEDEEERKNKREAREHESESKR